ncbi:unnamed protein product [Clonostachys rosea]|uniref:Uncharacterized protein n=1 Tax=Bionectria ochroleuca TaxID=29856 RepID=A0ABY6UEG9_BIOOC|nr:unnamed protein product [Clonostachys rosea]
MPYPGYDEFDLPESYRGPRRSSQSDPRDLQYHTPRAKIPMRVLEDQTRRSGYPSHDHLSRSAGFQPSVYRNSERIDGVDVPLFEQYEYPPGSTLVEVPIDTRCNFDQKPTPYRKVAAGVAPRGRGHLVNHPHNDPGVLRGVVPVRVEEINGSEVVMELHDPLGVTYHPPGNSRGFRRAPIEPRDREGHQYDKRYDDDVANPSRVTTWPPRDEDARDLTEYESRYSRKPRKSERKLERRQREGRA